MTTKDIQLAVGASRVLAGHTCVCENVSSLLNAREMDVISVKNGKLYEYEVKISRQDFLADKKKRKHLYTGENGALIPDWNPNFFSYVCPENLIRPEEVPGYAGLYYIIEGEMTLVKKPKLYNPHVHDLNKIEKKVIRVMQERNFLGGCRLTYENRLVEKRNREIAPELFKDSHK